MSTGSVLCCHQIRLDGHSKCCLTLLSDVVLPGLSDAVVPDLVVRRSIAVDLYGQKLTYTKVDLVLCSSKAG